MRCPALLLLLVCTAVCPAQVQTDHVRPVDTDPGYDPLEDSSAVSWNAGAQNDRLLLFLGGTGSSSSSSYNALRLFAAGLGFHVINLSYPNNVATAGLANDPDTLVFEKYRQELCFGTPVSDAVAVDSLNAIHTRTLNLLRYLDQTHPTQNWGQFLATPDSLDWSRVAVGGHSQGSGHACYLAKHFPVERVLMFAGPNDYSDLHGNSGHWVRQLGATPVGRHYSYLSLHDEAVAYWKQFSVVQGLGSLVNDDSVHVDPLSAPYGGSHCLYTTQPPGLALLYHNTPVMLSTTNSGVWTYLLTSAVTVSAVEEKDPRQLGVRPNPARDRVRIQFTNTDGPATLEVLDATGRLLRRAPYPGGAVELDLNDLPTGMLLLAVTDAQGRSVARLVVER